MARPNTPEQWQQKLDNEKAARIAGIFDRTKMTFSRSKY